MTKFIFLLLLFNLSVFADNCITYQNMTSKQLRGEYDDKVWQNQEEKRKVQSMVGRYKKQAMKHLDSVCVGNF